VVGRDWQHKTTLERTTMNSEVEWQQAIKQAANDPKILLAYADWIEQNGDQTKAYRVRERAGAGKLLYALSHPSWGEERFGGWAKLIYLISHVKQKPEASIGGYRRKAGEALVPISELVVVYEWRAKPIAIERWALSDSENMSA
jgi:uncharacterized protein (TIGR02996 family)